MATTYHNIEGFIKWAKLYEPDEYLGVKRWSVNFYPKDAAALAKLKKSGISLKIQKDADGEYVKLRRPTKKEIKDDIVVFAPPEIRGKVEVSYVDQDGERITSHRKGDGKEIRRKGEKVDLGNGTEVLVNFCVYTTVKGNGHRLEQIKVLNLVEYNGGEVTEEPLEEEETKVEPKKAETKVTTNKGSKMISEPKPSLHEELNDELPW